MLEDERDLLIEDVHNEKELRKEWQTVGRSLAFLCEKIFNKKPTVRGTKVIYDISTIYNATFRYFWSDYGSYDFPFIYCSSDYASCITVSIW